MHRLRERLQQGGNRVDEDLGLRMELDFELPEHVHTILVNSRAKGDTEAESAPAVALVNQRRSLIQQRPVYLHCLAV